eukprot:m.22350 g.22350  ORF g.22350 m.22350 type:complete len:627 (+) comp7391_c0_seq1:295-2175(+)
MINFWSLVSKDDKPLHGNNNDMITTSHRDGNFGKNLEEIHTRSELSTWGGFLTIRGLQLVLVVTFVLLGVLVCFEAQVFSSSMTVVVGSVLGGWVGIMYAKGVYRFAVYVSDMTSQDEEKIDASPQGQEKAELVRYMKLRLECPLEIKLAPNMFLRACLRGHSDTVRAILQALPVPFKAQCHGCMIASHEGHLNVVQELTKKNSSVATCPFFNSEFQGVNALHVATRADRLDIAKYLIEEIGVSVNSTRLNDGMTALHLAAVRGNEDMVKLLLTNNADVALSENSDTLTPLHIACWNGSAKIINYLLDSAETLASKKHLVNMIAPNGCSPLHYAACFGDASVIKILLKADAAVNARQHGYLRTPLYYATKMNKVEAVKMLLNARADTDIKTSEHVTPYLEACAQDNLPNAIILSCYGANRTCKTSLGESALAVCIKNNSKNVMKWLFQTADWSQAHLLANYRMWKLAEALFSVGKLDITNNKVKFLTGAQTTPSVLEVASGKVTLEKDQPYKLQCPKTLYVFRNASVWKPTWVSHALFGPQHRQKVMLVMLVKQRLGHKARESYAQHKNAAKQTKRSMGDNNNYRYRNQSQNESEIMQEKKPILWLPDELWFHVLGLMGRKGLDYC